MESFCEDVSEKDEDDDWFEDSKEIEAVNKLLRKDEELKKLTAITLHKPQVSQLSSELNDPPDLKQLSVINPSSVSPSIHNALILNKACQAVLIQLEKKLEARLEENLKKQKELLKYINLTNKSNNFLTSKTFIKCLGMPYFKDLEGFTPPPNKDTLQKISNNELLPEDLATNLRTWSVTDQNDLKKSVIDHVKNLKFKELSKRENDLKRVGHINIDDYKAVIAEIEALKNASDESLDIDPKKIDWMKISVQDMKGLFSDTECESKWVLELDLKLNKSKWKKSEFESLVEIVKEHNFQNWDAIAEKLGTNRSSFQCCVQFYSKKTFKEGKWTDEEFERALELRNKYKIKDYIPWVKIAWHFDTRSLKQITCKFDEYINPQQKKGRFDKIEDSMIIIGAKEFSNDFSKISECIPERTPKQLRSRFDYLIGKHMAPFTKEEEEKLISLVGQYSKNWKVISEHFENRSSLQCRKYWRVIEKSIQECEFDEEYDSSLSESLQHKETACEVTNIDLDSMYIPKHYSKQKEDLADRSAAYVLLLNYLHTGHEFFFGPRSRNYRDFDLIMNLVYKTQIAMETLKVPLNALTYSENDVNLIGSFEESNLGSSKIIAEEESVLYHLQLNPVFQENQDTFINNALIPPNYTTLVGLRSFMLGRAVIQNFATDSIPEKNDSYKIRKTFEEAKELWKNRLKILFTLPIVCSLIDFKPEKGVKKGRVNKPKPMSQRKRKAHALYLTEAKRLKKSIINEDNIVFVRKDDNPVPRKKKVNSVSDKPRGRPRKNPVNVAVPERNVEAVTESTGVRRTERRTKISCTVTSESQ